MKIGERKMCPFRMYNGGEQRRCIEEECMMWVVEKDDSDFIDRYRQGNSKKSFDRYYCGLINKE